PKARRIRATRIKVAKAADHDRKAINPERASAPPVPSANHNRKPTHSNRGNRGRVNRHKVSKARASKARANKGRPSKRRVSKDNKRKADRHRVHADSKRVVSKPEANAAKAVSSSSRETHNSRPPIR